MCPGIRERRTAGNVAVGRVVNGKLLPQRDEGSLDSLEHRMRFCDGSRPTVALRLHETPVRQDGDTL